MGWPCTGARAACTPPLAAQGGTSLPWSRPVWPARPRVRRRSGNRDAQRMGRIAMPMRWWRGSRARRIGGVPSRVGLRSVARICFIDGMPAQALNFPVHTTPQVSRRSRPGWGRFPAVAYCRLDTCMLYQFTIAAGRIAAASGPFSELLRYFRGYFVICRCGASNVVQLDERSITLIHSVLPIHRPWATSVVPYQQMGASKCGSHCFPSLPRPYLCRVPGLPVPNRQRPPRRQPGRPIKGLRSPRTDDAALPILQRSRSDRRDGAAADRYGVSVAAYGNRSVAG